VDNSPEEIEAQKSRAFRPPEVDIRDDLRLLIRYIIFSLIFFFSIYYLLGFVYIKWTGGGWPELRVFVLRISFAATIIFGIFRTLRFSMAQIASDAMMIFPMHTSNVRSHLRDLVDLATSVEWDLIGLFGSLAVLLLTMVL